MIQTNPLEKCPEWDSNDVSALRAFLASPTGRKVFPVLVDEGPTLGGAEMSSVALHAKFAQGYEACMSVLARLTRGIEKPSVEEAPAYPSLTDDRYWSGPKLNTQEEN
jgi:DNA-binding transcriptional ArsR family regulator